MRVAADRMQDLEARGLREQSEMARDGDEHLVQLVRRAERNRAGTLCLGAQCLHSCMSICAYTTGGQARAAPLYGCRCPGTAKKAARGVLREPDA